MKYLLTILALLALCTAAVAKKPVEPDVTIPTRVSCELNVVTYDWDFAAGDMGFTSTTCDPTGGDPVWEWGSPTGFIPPGHPANVWGTVLQANYPNNSGESLVSPEFTVSAEAYKMEILHFVHIENNFDGCNVTVNGTIVEPIEGYPATISTSTSFYAFCVDEEPGFTGLGFNGPSEDWVTRCFDLSPWMGEAVQVSFDFGTDSSVQYPGWYLGYVKVGSPEGVATGDATWGQIKGLYR